MAEVVLTNIRKVYKGDTGDVVAVDDFNLVIQDKEFVVLVGPSGCGKTTTLRMVAGLEEISSGTISIGGRVVNNVPPKNRDIAMVFQNYALYPHMTVYKNMAFGLRLRGLPKKEIDERVREAARILGIGDLLDRKPKALSGGQRQRVAVGRAIVRQPAAFLFDEPLSNLDAKLRVEMRAELKRLHRRLETTMIYVTHDQIEAMTLADRVVVMSGGHIQQVDAPLRVYDYPANKFVAGFLGTPSMNFVSGRLEQRGEEVVFVAAGDEGATIQLTPRLRSRAAGCVGKEVTLGIRPENMSHQGTGHFAGKGNVLVATVRVVEPLGDEQIVHLDVGRAARRHTLIAKLDSHVPVAVDERFEVHLNMQKVHLFDGETNENVTLEPNHVVSRV